MMLISGTMPPSGVNESCMPLTAPQLASVVIVAKSAELRDPEANFLALHVAAGLHGADVCWSMPCSNGLPCASAEYATVTPARNRIAMAAHTAQPCLWRARHPAKRVGKARPRAKIITIWMKFGERSGILKRVSAIGVERAAAVRSEIP